MWKRSFRLLKYGILFSDQRYHYIFRSLSLKYFRDGGSVQDIYRVSGGACLEQLLGGLQFFDKLSYECNIQYMLRQNHIVYEMQMEQLIHNAFTSFIRKVKISNGAALFFMRLAVCLVKDD